MKTLEYLDPITKRLLTYHIDDYFIIFTKKHRKTREIKKIYQAKNIKDAFQDFYELIVYETEKKYLYYTSYEDFKKKKYTTKILLEMQGFCPSPTKVKVRYDNTYYTYDKKSTINLIHTPLSLAKKMESLDLDSLPVINDRWTMTKIGYTLFSYLFSLSDKKRNEILSIGWEKYREEKMLSTGDPEQFEKYKKIVSSNKDIEDLL